MKKVQKRDNSNKVLEFNRDHEFLFNIAIKHAMKKNLESAIKYIDKAIQIDNYNADYLFNKACILVEMKRVDESIEILNSIIWRIDPTYAGCYFGLGCNYFEMGKYSEALACFEKYVAIVDDGEYIDDAYDILLYLQFSSENGDIFIDRKRVNKINDRNSYLKSSLRLDEDGRRLLFSGNYSGAIEKFEKSIKTYPENTNARVRLSMAYFMMGDVSLAKCLAASALKLQRGNYLAKLCLAFYYTAEGQMDMSEKMLMWLEKVRAKRYSSVRSEAQMFYDLLVTKAPVGEKFKSRITGAVQKLTCDLNRNRS
ncbi:MAG: tetratricopeptide repeat protein [Oscillospiraceae bacterium]|nr:tetratricopeptide repeat protein [Oscillospiraceae bacterium]